MVTSKVQMQLMNGIIANSRAEEVEKEIEEECLGGEEAEGLVVEVETDPSKVVEAEEVEVPGEVLVGNKPKLV